MTIVTCIRHEKWRHPSGSEDGVPALGIGNEVMREDESDLGPISKRHIRE